MHEAGVSVPRCLGQAPASAPFSPLAPGRRTPEPGLFPRAGAGECLGRFDFWGALQCGTVQGRSSVLSSGRAPAGPAGGSPGQQRRCRASPPGCGPGSDSRPVLHIHVPAQPGCPGVRRPLAPHLRSTAGGGPRPASPPPCPVPSRRVPGLGRHQLLGGTQSLGTVWASVQGPGPGGARSQGSGAGWVTLSQQPVGPSVPGCTWARQRCPPLPPGWGRAAWGHHGPLWAQETGPLSPARAGAGAWLPGTLDRHPCAAAPGRPWPGGRRPQHPVIWAGPPLSEPRPPHLSYGGLCRR